MIDQLREHIQQACEEPWTFRSWLTGKDGTATVGTPSEGDRCPIATYLRETVLQTFGDYYEIAVGENGEVVLTNDEMITVIEGGEYPWMEDFITEVDDYDGPGRDADGYPRMNAEEALAAFARSVDS